MSDEPLRRPSFLLTLLDTVGVTTFLLTDATLVALSAEGTSVLREDEPITPAFRTVGVTLVATRPLIADSAAIRGGFARNDADEAELRSTPSSLVMGFCREAEIGARATVRERAFTSAAGPDSIA